MNAGILTTEQSPPKQPRPESGFATTLAASLLAVVLLLLFHPYRGILHDSTIYAGQVLALLDPVPFAHDLFFTYGSQAQFSLFPSVVARLVQILGLGSAFLWLTLAGLLAFVIASWGLLRQLLPESSRFPALLALLLLPASYGAWGILSYAEPFLTGRSFAEPLCLAALAALIGQRRTLAGLLGLAALALHPLQAGPALVIGWLWLAQQDHRWLHLLWLPILAGAVCFALPQLSFLTARMDALWFQQVWDRNLVVFYSHSGIGDWNYLLKDAFVVAVATRHAASPLRRYLISVLAASLLLFGFGLALADGLHLTWLAGVQLWRVHWLLHWTATAILPWLCIHLWRHSTHDKLRLLVFVCAVILGLMPSAAHPMFLITALLYWVWPWLSQRIGLTLQRILAMLCLGIALIYVLPNTLALTPWGAPLGTTRWVDALMQPRLPAALLLPAVLAVLWLWQRYATTRLHWILLPALFFGALLSGYQWDQRSALQRAFTDQPHDAQPFGINIAHDAQVLWLGNLLPAWSVLHRPHYIQQQQLSGIVFNRATSIEGYRRKELLHVKDGQGQDCRIVVFPKEPFIACKPDATAVRQACENSQGELTYIVLYYPLNRLAAGIWAPNNGAESTYYLYACRDLTNTAVATQPSTQPTPHAPAP